MFHVRPTRLIVIYSLYDRIIHCATALFKCFAVTDTQSQTRLTIMDRRLAVTDTQYWSLSREHVV